MRLFSVGDRVVVYGYRPRRLGSTYDMKYSRGDKGVVDTITSETEIIINFDDGASAEVHPAQCRKLYQPRRIMLHLEDVQRVSDGCIYHAAARPVGQLHGPHEEGQYVEFVEVRRK